MFSVQDKVIFGDFFKETETIKIVGTREIS